MLYFLVLIRTFPSGLGDANILKRIQVQSIDNDTNAKTNQDIEGNRGKLIASKSNKIHETMTRQGERRIKDKRIEDWKQKLELDQNRRNPRVLRTERWCVPIN